MKGFLKGLLIFSAGFCVGCMATNKYLNKLNEEYEREYDEPKEDEYEEEDDENMTFKEYFEGETGRKYTGEENDDEYERVRDRYDTITNSINATNEAFEHCRDDVDPLDESPRYNGRDDLEADEVAFETRADVGYSTPYFIDEDEFESLDDYESDEYTMYADGYITDSYGMPMDPNETEELFGPNFASLFEAKDEDQVYVRNEQLRMDFSIIRDLDNFEEVAPVRIRRLIGLD